MPHRKHRLALVLHAVLAGGALSLPATGAWADSSTHSYHLPGASLEDALSQVARQAGITLPMDPALVAGKRAPALQGEYNVGQALDHLLQGSGLQAREVQPGIWALAATMAGSPLSLDNMVITASQTRHSELTAPASVSVISREQLQQMQALDLSEAVAKVPGVSIAASSTFGRHKIKMRGLDSDYTLLLVNGRRINSRDALTSNYANDFDLSAIPLSAVERIEVIRGPMSSLYGADAMGGVINVILRRPGNEAEGALSYSYQHTPSGDGGDINHSSLYSAGPLIEDRLLGNLVLDASDQAAWKSSMTTDDRAHAREQRQNWAVMSNLNWLIDDSQDLELDFSARNDQRDGVWNNSNVNFPRNQQEMERYTFGLTHNAQLERANTRLRYYHEQVNLSDDSQLTTALRGVAGDVRQRNQTVDGQISGDLGNHLLTAGAEYRHTLLEHNQNLDGDATDFQRALYLQDEIALGDLRLTLGGRLDDHKTFGSEFSPRAYAVYSLTDDWVIKGGVGKAFKAPSISQADPSYAIPACRGRCVVAGNPELKPETATAYEIGTLYQSETLELGANLFYNDIKDMILADGWRPGHMPAVLTYYNVSSARTRGVELLSSAQLSETLKLSANYTLTEAEDRDTGEELRQVPKHTANADLNWQLTPRWQAQLGYQYIGSQVLRNTISNQDVDSAAYHLVNLGSQYQLTPQLSLNAGVKNLGDSDRDSAARDADYIELSRTLYAGFTLAF
ncbi:TonB-dependent receptor domain-containing protein [Pseudomonas sp. BJa5]|uniref:TonB-dependent receptor n=1 Tax=Pseudomonas sp. BJa5 TaxID=2936270 RepID=UPI0025599097|nr:TonB-dependent receptor [Pseudomonas sp. BGr12]MDL2422993.1 TonB-dependent receptor [Pseudomonas sp. BGr12]